MIRQLVNGVLVFTNNVRSRDPVANYRIEGLYLNSRSNEVSHTAAAYDVAPRLYIPLGIELK